MNARSEARIWFGPEREPPHFDRPTLFVEGRPPLYAFLDALRNYPVAAVYFGAGRVDDHDPTLLAIAVAKGRPVVLEARSEGHAETVPTPFRHLVELVVATEARGWASVAFKDDTNFSSDPCTITYLTPSETVDVTDPLNVRFDCDTPVWPLEDQ